MIPLLSCRIPPREETSITLYDGGFIEIEQTPPEGETTFPVRINAEDVATIQDILEKMRHHKGPEPAPAAQHKTADVEK